MLYLDFLPRELIYIINKYLGVKNPLIRISEHYKNVHRLYLNNLKRKFEHPRIEDVHRGFYNPFGCIREPKGYRFEQRNNGILTGVILSTSKYFDRNDYRYIIETNSDWISSDKCIIYARHSESTYSGKESMMISTNDRIGNKYILTNDDYRKGEFNSNKWIKIWEHLSLDDQNAILYQNGFPLKNIK